MPAYTNKLARVYLSADVEEIKNLAKYTDPFDLTKTLQSMEYQFNGEGVGTYSLTVDIINPAFSFETKLLQLYRMYFFEDKFATQLEQEDDPTLTFYARWGYGSEASDGLSRVLACKLIDIKYSLTALNEKVMSIRFVDNLTYGLEKDPAHASGKGTVVTSEVNCLEDGKLRNPGEVIGELLAQYISSFIGVKPVSLMYYSRGIGTSIDQLYSLIANRISSGDITSNVSIEGLGSEVDVFSTELLGVEAAELTDFEGVNIDLIPGVSWDDIKVGNVPSTLHKIAAYKMLMNAFGINFVFGYEEKNLVEDLDIQDEGQDLMATMSAAEQALTNVEFDSLDIPLPDNTALFSGTYGDGVLLGTIDELRGDPAFDLAFPESSYKNGTLLFRPGGFPLTYGNANQWVANTPSYQYYVIGDAYITNPSKTFYVVVPFSTAKMVREALDGIKKDKNIDQSLVPEHSEVKKEGSVGTIHINSGDAYSLISLSKPTGASSSKVVSNVLKKINDSLLPMGLDEGKELTVIQIPITSLSDENLKSFTAAAGTISFRDSDTVMLITSNQNVKSIFGFDTEREEEDLELFSFPSLQDKNTLKLSLGYDDSIITDIQFDESIIAAYPTSLYTFDLFRDVKEVFVSEGNLRSWYDIKRILMIDMATANKFAIAGLPTKDPGVLVRELQRLGNSKSETEFFNYYIGFVTKAQRGEYGDNYKGIINDMKYASSFAKLASSDKLRLLFGDDIVRDYTYDTGSGSLKISSTYKFKSVNIGDHIVGFLTDNGDDRVSDYTRVRLNEYLYSSAAFKTRVTTLGIPEVSSPIMDIASRKVHLRISETRLPGETEHWLSGYYQILGYNHRYDKVKGYTTSFNIVRLPFANRVGALNAR